MRERSLAFKLGYLCLAWKVAEVQPFPAGTCLPKTAITYLAGPSIQSINAGRRQPALPISARSSVFGL